MGFDFMIVLHSNSFTCPFTLDDQLLNNFDKIMIVIGQVVVRLSFLA